MPEWMSKGVTTMDKGKGWGISTHMKNVKIAIVNILPPIFGLLSISIVYELISLFQNFYYKQERHLSDFLPGAGFCMFFLVSLSIAIILQFALFKYVYKFNKFIIFLVIISSILLITTFIFANSVNESLLLSSGLILYLIVNYFTYKRSLNRYKV